MLRHFATLVPEKRVVARLGQFGTVWNVDCYLVG